MEIEISEKDVSKEEAITLFSPKNPTPIETIFLSNIDQAVTFPVETLFFFQLPQDMCSSTTMEIGNRVKRAVAEVLLVPYYFMAGRLIYNDITERLELLCNNQGVPFVSANSSLLLKDLGNISAPNPSFHHFVHKTGLYKSLAETALFTIQVTRFKCGGYVIGFSTNHCVLDGKSASEMFGNLASICRGEGTKHHHLY
ncbi:hypothetical protein ACFE04_007187 [Oxalis oulophora]